MKHHTHTATRAGDVQVHRCREAAEAGICHTHRHICTDTFFCIGSLKTFYELGKVLFCFIVTWVVVLFQSISAIGFWEEPTFQCSALFRSRLIKDHLMHPVKHVKMHTSGL